MVQMHQKDRIGGGDVEDENGQEVYRTWEFKECPGCGRKVVEYYSAIAVSDLEEEVIIKEVLKLKK